MEASTITTRKYIKLFLVYETQSFMLQDITQSAEEVR